MNLNIISILCIIELIIFIASLIVIFFLLKFRNQSIKQLTSLKEERNYYITHLNFDEDFKFLLNIIQEKISTKIKFALKLFPSVNQKGNKLYIKDSVLEEDVINLTNEIMNSLSKTQFIKLYFYFNTYENLLNYITSYIYIRLAEAYLANNYSINKVLPQ